MSHTTVLAAAGHAAGQASAANAGAAVLMLMLGAGIFVGLRSKKLTLTELVVCGSFGLLAGATSLGSALHGPLASLGFHLLNWTA